VPGSLGKEQVMADQEKNPGIEAAVAAMKKKVNQEVEQHKGEEFNLDELEDVSGGWAIYSTDPAIE
jgi:hypothetical protein